jgi:hypothetical protein
VSANSGEQFQRAWKQTHTRDGGCAQGASDGQDINLGRVGAECAQRTGEQSVRVLLEQAIVFTQQPSQGIECSRWVELR